jgi:hypothetical protein
MTTTDKVHRILDELYGCEGFDKCWIAMDRRTRDEIILAIAAIIDKPD